MNLTEMEEGLHERIRRAATPRMRLIIGILLLLVLGGLLYSQLTSPAQIQKRNHRASVHFGEALERAGIVIQPSPAK